MNSKEALEKLYDGFQNGMAGRSFYEIIKQDLDRLESLEAKFDAYYELHKQLEKGYDELSVETEKLIQENRNLKKVIDILKDCLDIQLWKTSDGKYYLRECYDDNLLTQEEYDLLTEHFGNEKKD